MAKYVTEKTIQTVFPNAECVMGLTAKQFQAAQNAVQKHKIRKDSVREVELYTDEDGSNRTVHIDGMYYRISVMYKNRQWQSRLVWSHGD